MFMSNNKIFLDSSILVEYVKGTKTDLLDYLLNDSSYTLFISQIVISEFYFHALATYGLKSPLTLKMSGSIGGIMQLHKPQEFLHLFDFLVDDATFVDTAASLMVRYNLLPNDAFNYYQLPTSRYLSHCQLRYKRPCTALQRGEYGFN